MSSTDNHGSGNPASGARGWSDAWRIDSRKFRLLAGFLLALFAVYAAIFLAITARRLTAAQPGGDFFALWSTVRFAATHSAVQVYDAAALHNAQVAQGLDPLADYPFPYPPFFLLALWPLTLLPDLPAYIVAIGGTLALYVWATVGNQWRSPMLPAALVAPTTTITLAAGQAGFLAAALLIGGFRLAGRRPIVAGILLGLATYKPQLGLLVPVALVAAGLWRSIMAAAATVAALVAAATVAFGVAVWPAWAAELLRYADEFASANSRVGHLMPTVAESLAQLGASPPLVDAGQFAAAALAAWVVWRCFRSGPNPLAAAALFVATLLATPHAFVYDMPPVATAVLWAIAERHRAAVPLATSDIVVMTVAMLAPIALVAGGSGSLLVVLSLALLLAALARRCLVAPPPAQASRAAESP